MKAGILGSCLAAVLATGIGLGQAWETSPTGVISGWVATGPYSAVLRVAGTNVLSVTGPAMQAGALASATATFGTGAFTNSVSVGGVTLYTLNAQLVRDVASGAYQITQASFDPTYLTMQTGAVLWADGSAGAWTNLATNTTFGAVDSYLVTHVNSGKTITQPLVTRSGTGQVTNKPALTITP